MVSFTDSFFKKIQHISQANIKQLSEKILITRHSSADISCMDQPDQLRELFRMQKALNERIGVSTDEFNDEQKTEWVLNYCRAMSQELAAVSYTHLTLTTKA